MKRILCLLLAVSLLLSLAACGGSPAASSAPVAGSMAAPAPSSTLPPSIDVPDAPEEVVVPLTYYPLLELQPFSENRAWVEYSGPTGRRSTALIDETGKALFNIEGELAYALPMTDGLSFVCLYDDTENVYRIVDRDGNVVSTNANGENNYYMTGYADGHFIVGEHVTGLDIDEWRMGTIDKDGNVLNEPIPVHFRNDSYGWRHLGNGMVHSGSIFYSVKGNSVGTLPEGDGGALYQDFDSGMTVLHVSGGKWGGDHPGYYNMSLAYLSDDIANTEIYAPLGLVADKWYGCWGEGLAYGTEVGGWEGHTENTRGYYDILSGSAVITFPEYEGREFICGPFRGGVAVMCIEGVDEEWYVTAIDKTGAQLYEPVKLDGVWGNDIASAIRYRSGRGYVLFTTSDRGYVVYGPDGRRLQPSVDDLSGIGDMTLYNEDGNVWCLSSGFFILDRQYISLDGKTVIDSVGIPEAAAGGEDSGQDIPPSDYTGSFELAGMWADEAGTILTFNANGSVGPMLFGFEGGPDGSWAISSGTNTAGHYTLQTSHITGGSPQYIVRLISADEIELYAEGGVNFGREYYHLTRQ